MSTTFLHSGPIWTRRVANELWSGPVTPLTYSLLAEPMAEHMVRRPLQTAGLERLAALPVLRHHASHVYVNAALLAETIRLLPAGLRSEGLLSLLPAAARTDLGAGASWLGGVAHALGIAERAWRKEPSWAPWERAGAFDRECVEVRRGFQNRGTFGAEPSTAELRDELVHVAERLGRYLDMVSWGMVFAYVFYHLMHELVRRWAPALTAEHAALTIGVPGVASLEAHYDLHTLARLLRSDPAIAAALAAHDAEAASALLARDDGTAGRAFRRFLEQHGHRLTGRDLSCPTWAESPGMVVELALAAGPDAAPDRTALARRRLEATDRILAAFGGGPTGALRRAGFRPVLDYAQRYYALRENMRYHADFFLARLRQVVLAFGAQLVARGQLAAATDVFWLGVEELAHAVEDAPTALGDLIAERRAAAARDACVPPPETLDVAVAGPVDGGVGDGALRGEVGAPGHCRGVARIVRGPADFERVEAGDVLVAVYTDPGWTSVLERAAGLVLEAGGVLSHGAIVARELGIPALVGVADATRALRDGDEIVVDADAGVVRASSGRA